MSSQADLSFADDQNDNNMDVYDSEAVRTNDRKRKRVEIEDSLVSGEYSEITKPIRRKECCLVLDYGKKVYNFLSVFAVFLDRTGTSPMIKTQPFMFMPTFEQKTTERIVEYIIEGGERLGLSREQVLSMRVVGDGAANIRKLGDFFESYSLCSCHSLQKAAERVLDPLAEVRLSFTPDEHKHLQELTSIVDDCSDLAATLRRNKNVYDLPKLPVAHCPTRWMTFINCCQDIVDLFSHIETIDAARVRQLREKIRPNLPQLITALHLLKLFESPLKLFEKTEMRLHEVAPLLFKLHRIFKEQEEQGTLKSNNTLRVVAKSATISLEHYISKTVSEPYLLASFLCPGMRKLSLFPDDYKKKALKLVEEEIEKVEIDCSAIDSPQKSDLTYFINCFSDKKYNYLRADLYDDPPPLPSADMELEDYKSSVFGASDTTMSPFLFWEKHKHRFPRLSAVAGSAYCVIASESICERSFSALNRVFRCDRQSMDPELVEILMISFLHLNNMK
uniref:Dimer_Tnp_hAT domain-containing protein n=1 Tax=Caenorhabditis tropicalis TaxID=1561998 RepID=A0A1I7U9S8_9PELO